MTITSFCQAAKNAKFSVGPTPARPGPIFETVAKHECNIERFVDENLFLGIAVDQSDPLPIGRQTSG
jgi:hypothetical protein